ASLHRTHLRASRREGAAPSGAPTPAGEALAFEPCPRLVGPSAPDQPRQRRKSCCSVWVAISSFPDTESGCPLAASTKRGRPRLPPFGVKRTGSPIPGGPPHQNRRSSPRHARGEERQNERAPALAR